MIEKVQKVMKIPVKFEEPVVSILHSASYSVLFEVSNIPANSPNSHSRLGRWRGRTIRRLCCQGLEPSEGTIEIPATQCIGT